MFNVAVCQGGGPGPIPDRDELPLLMFPESSTVSHMSGNLGHNYCRNLLLEVNGNDTNGEIKELLKKFLNV